MSDVTLILSRIEGGDSAAAAELLPRVYEELRHLAAAKLAQEQPGQTLQATALVHEAYLRLVDGEHVRPWNSLGHFFAAAAEAMRRILIEQARRKQGPKAGGKHRRIELSQAEIAADESPIDLLTLNEALNRLEAIDPRSARLVNLRFFAGLTIPQAADALGISVSTAKNDWKYAKTWLRAELMDVGSCEPDS